MKGVRKKFEQDVYNKYDGPAKEAMRKHLAAQGHTVTVPPENYDVDLFSDYLGVRMYHEVEVSEQWQEGPHSFFTGSVPERKIRLVKMHKNVPLYFWMLRFDLQRALVFPGHQLKDRYLVEVPNRKVEVGEYFYRIPKNLGKEFDLLT